MNHSSSNPHPIIAGFTDYYMLSAITMGALGLGKNAIGHLLSKHFIIGLFLGMLVIIVTYHVWLNKKTLWLSPGEKAAGKSIHNKKKEWINPYQKSRAFLFFVIVFTFFILGGEINGLIRPNLTTLTIAIKLLKFTLLFWGIVWLGRGKIKGAWFGFFIFLISAGLAIYVYNQIQHPLALQDAILRAIMAMLYLGTYFKYKKA